MKILLLLYVTTATIAVSLRTPLLHDNGLIVGGQDAFPGQFPFLLSFTKDEYPFCAATILDETTALTAAHCVYGSNPNNPAGLQVIAGQYSINADDTTEQFIDVKSFIVHENFNYNTVENDIAILQLASPITMNEFVKPASLPSQGQETRDGQCVVAGWGTSNIRGMTDTLQYVEVPYVSDEVCKEDYGGDMVFDSMICAGTEGKDACQGDSGGSLMCEGYQAGIVSWGIGCGEPNHPGVYTQVSYFIDWLNSHR